jgi:murein DD-endopeptidase MepM/ murein hydrolase activator NlpD
MPVPAAVLARARTRVVGGVVALAFAGVAGVTNAPVAAAATPRPALRSPFACGQVWFARTYPGHPRFAVDWNLPGSGEADFGQPVLAGGDGVATVSSDAGYGNMVTIDHGGGWRTLYAHLSAFDVATGQQVTSGTVIGRVGRTGRADGSHLHQEQSLDGVRQPIELDGVAIVASYSSRGASYASANCAPPAAPRSHWSARARMWGSRWGSAQGRPLP